MPNTKICWCLAEASVLFFLSNSCILRAWRLKICVIFMPERFSERKVLMSVVPSLTLRYALRENLRKMSVNSTMKGAKHSTMSVSSRCRINMATSTPKTTNTFLMRLTRMFVNIIEMALVSLVTRVTSFPTGMRLSWACESPSMCENRSSRREERIRWPVFCRTMACAYELASETTRIPA